MSRSARRGGWQGKELVAKYVVNSSEPAHYWITYKLTMVMAAILILTKVVESLV